MKFYTAFFVFNIFSLLGISQTIKVVDEINLQAVENVYIYSNEKTALTNKYGEANINVFNSSDTIIFQHSSFETYIISYNDLKKLNFEIKLSESILNINEIVVSANRWEQNKEEVPNKITMLSAKQIAFLNPQTAADMLGATDEVFIQKSQMGGGSPMIRGFSANRILIVVDGVRMNNAIFRSGNLQNIISIDANSVENAEVVFGPGSVIYGSDALGGVMDFHTLTPKLSTTDKLYIFGSALTRYSSANNEKTGHLHLNIGGKKWSSVTSFTYSDFDDMKMGSIGNNEYTRPEYVKWIDGKDSVIINPNENKQVFSGYSQVNFMQKIRFRPNDKWDFNYGFHYSKLSNVPRYDRLIQYKNDKLKYADWYYGPQKWMMNVLNIKYSDSTLFFDVVKLTLAYQNYEESRHDRKFGKDDIRERTEKVDAISVNLDIDKCLNKNMYLFYGVEAVTNIISSVGQERNIYSGKTKAYASRYPDGSNYSTFAGYLNLKNNFNKKLTLISGLRYSRVVINSTFDTSFYKFPYSSININTGALNGSIGLAYRPTTSWQFNLNTSTGYRAPNIDDVGKVFDSEPGNVIVPNENLKPEYAYNIDFGIVKTINHRIKFDFTVFYTLLKNAMVRRNFTFNGQDSVIYDGEKSRVQALVNADEATIYGVQFGLYADIITHFSFKTNITYTKGEDKEGVPLRHVAPLFGSAHLIFKAEKIKVDLYINYNGEISNSNMSPSEIDKPYMYATNNDGNPYSPSWATLNIKASYHINKYLQANLGIENILNARYRPYSSGIVSAGRNFIVGLRGIF